jgi:hypothetical protein
MTAKQIERDITKDLEQIGKASKIIDQMEAEITMCRKRIKAAHELLVLGGGQPITSAIEQISELGDAA